MSGRVLLSFVASLFMVGHAWSQALPSFSEGGPDAEKYGIKEGYPLSIAPGQRTQRNMVGDYSHFDLIRPSHKIAAPPEASALHRADQEIELAYEFQGHTETLAGYFDHTPATGLLILHDSKILFEHYHYARTEQDRFTSQSMAKTILGMLVGIALHDGEIRSLDEPVSAYVPDLAGLETGKTPLRALLQMSSGIDFHEVYNGRDDIMRLGRSLMQKTGEGPTGAVRAFNTRVAPPGALFNYSGLDSELLGLVVSRATGKSLAELVQTRIWGPMGAEFDASWTIDANGQEVAYCCFNAALRDWGRLGLLMARDGTWDGTPVVPKEWLLASTTLAAPGLSAGNNGRKLGYGYQVWLLPGEHRQFALLGIYGQNMLVDPDRDIVLVQTAVLPRATDPQSRQELFALWQALVARLSATE